MRNSSLTIQAGKTFLFALFLITFLGSCSSQYHWVKVKSADPNLIKKEDVQYAQIPNNTLDNGTPVIAPESTTTVKNAEEPIINLQSLRGADHGSNSIAKTTAVNKAIEIEKTLSPERKAALASKDIAIRTQAVKETLHEQFSKVAGFNKLSSNFKEKIENSLSKKLAKRDLRGELRGFNQLLLWGVILLLLSIIFYAAPPLQFLGALLDVVGVVLIILGLVQMFG